MRSSPDMDGVRIRVAFVASEAAPFAKTGGLADVAGSLPAALQKQHIDIRLILPGYRQIRSSQPSARRQHGERHARLGNDRLVFHVEQIQDRGPVPVYLIEREDMFDRPNLYGNADGDYYDNAERFIFFCRAAVELMRTWNFRPHVIHCHDWQTGLIPVYMQSDPVFREVQSLFTVHNMGYPGLFGPDKFALTGLDASHYQLNGLEFYGLWSMLKAGLVYSRAVNTVSPAHAHEIQTAEYGQGMEGVLQHRAGSVSGILNGVDYGIWNPAYDSHIPACYTSDDLSGKKACKAGLIRECHLNDSVADVPVMGIISRLDVQKGIDLVISILPDLMASEPVGVVILGTGDRVLQTQLQRISERYSGRVSFFPRFDAGLARRILAGSDMLLMPSRYEPCGLTQLYALKYGTIPVVRSTGGLRDTVWEVNGETGDGTGFTFEKSDSDTCLATIKRAIRVYHRPEIWHRIRLNAMEQDFSWDQAAHHYRDLYQSISTFRTA